MPFFRTFAKAFAFWLVANARFAYNGIGSLVVGVISGNSLGQPLLGLIVL